jgi:virginiamycin B lyase
MLPNSFRIAPRPWALAATLAVSMAVEGPPTTLASQRVSAGCSDDACITEYALPRDGSRPFQVVFGADNAVWFTEKGPQCGSGGGNAIGRMDADGTITEYPVPYPSAIVAGPDDAFWFGEQIANNIGRLTTDGTLTEFPVPTSGKLQFKDCAYDSSAPGEGYTLFGPDGNLWFTESIGNKIVKMTLDGHMQEFGVPTPDSGPLTLTLGPDGALWFIERKASKVGRITLGGEITDFAMPTNNAYPNAIVAGPDGALWFTELFGDRVGRITLRGAITEYPTQGVGPVGIVVGADNALWIAAYTSNEIVRMTLDGQITDRYPIPTPNANVISVTLGPDGSIWFNEDGGNKIGRLQVPPAQH